MFDQEIGGVKTPRRIIDQQRGSECGYEAVENAIQLVHPVKNNVSERDLKPRSIRYGYAWARKGDLLLDTQGYQPLLTAHQIASKWLQYDRRTLTEALRANRVAIAVVNPHYLDPLRYSFEGDLHAIVITNFATDSNRKFMAYTGMDSNSGGKEVRWPMEAVERGIAAGLGQIRLTDTKIHFSLWANYEVLVPRGNKFIVTVSPTP